MEGRFKDLVRMALVAALLHAGAGCVHVTPPMIVPASEEETEAGWRLVKVGASEGGWMIEAIFVPGSSEDVLSAGEIAADLDSVPAQFTFDASFQKLRAVFPSLAAGDHLFRARPSPRAAGGYPPLVVRFTVAP